MFRKLTNLKNHNNHIEGAIRGPIRVIKFFLKDTDT